MRAALEPFAREPKPYSLQPAKREGRRLAPCVPEPRVGGTPLQEMRHLVNVIRTNIAAKQVAQQMQPGVRERIWKTERRYRPSGDHASFAPHPESLQAVHLNPLRSRIPK